MAESVSRCFTPLSLIPLSPLPAPAICSREAINFLEGRCCLFMHSGVFPRLAHRAEMHAPFMYVDHRIYHGHSCGLACWASQTYASKETQYARRKKARTQTQFRTGRQKRIKSGLSLPFATFFLSGSTSIVDRHREDWRVECCSRYRYAFVWETMG